MDIREAGQPRQFLVEARIVLHRAGAKRVQPAVDRVIFLRQSREVPHDLRLAQARQANRVPPFQTAEATEKRRRLGQIDAAVTRRILLKNQRLLDLQPTVTGRGRDWVEQRICRAGAYRRAPAAHERTSRNPCSSRSISSAVVNSVVATSRMSLRSSRCGLKRLAGTPARMPL